LGHPGSVNFNARPSEPLPFGASIAQSGPDALLDQRPLELCHGADDLEHQPARRRAQIKIVAEADKGYSVCAKVRERIDQMLQRPTEAVNFPDKHGIELAAMSVGHQLIQFWTRFL